MPTGFLSDAEIERLGRFPEAIDDRDLARFFRLDGEDLRFVRRQHSAAGQLGMALQLCLLRWLGFIPDDLAGAPPETLNALAATLDVPARVIFDYSVRPQTRREHRPLVREHAGFVAGGERELEPVRAWLTERALVQSRHAWLRSRPTSVSASALRRELDKRAFLISELGADRFDLSPLPPNRRAWLAQTGRQSTNQALARLAPQRRYPVLLCFCGEALERATDDALEVFDRALGAAERVAQRKREELERRTRRDTQTTVRRFVDLAQALFEARDAHTDVLRLIDRRIGLDRLRDDLDRAERILRPHGSGHLDILLESAGAAGRKLLASVLAGVEFKRSGVDEDELLAALRLIGELAATGRRWLPGFAPSAFIDQQWRAHVVDVARGRLDRRATSCAPPTSCARRCAPGGSGSRAAAGTPTLRACCSPPSPGSRPARRSCRRSTGPSTSASGCALAGEQAELLERLAEVPDGEAVARLKDGDLVVDPAAVGDVDEGRLRKLIAPRLPEIDLPELLIEVDGWTGFTDHLTPLSGNRRRSADLPCLLYAVIVAQATNLGLSGMAKASAFSYQQLEWAWEQLCREDTLTAASARLVDYHHALPLAQAWGAGRLSSSDGQRFSSRTRGPSTAPLPRYFGHRRRGLQIYSWTSDQYSQYASKVVAATVRDATHTLDGILDNQTVLPVAEHTTDTHGYTEMIFGAYDLLGLRFAPRIRDLDRQRLYRHGPTPAVETAELLRHKLRPELITPYWDELLRLAASLRHGWAPASLLLSRLHAGSRSSPLARALQEYGRLVETNFVLAWLGDDELRRRIGRQLNKGEQLHALRRAIFDANGGHVRQRTPEQQAEQALCLAIVGNAVIAWNTVYIQRVLDELLAAGELITISEIERISPLAHQHIHLYGHYPFDLATRPDGHRPLRVPAIPAAPAPRTLNRV